MAGDDWTVVGSRGRPRKPRQQPGSGSRLSDRSGGSPAAGTRASRRSAEADADDSAAEEQQEQGTEPPEPLPGWGVGNGHGSGVKGRAGRAKRRQAWVERSPAERVESLKRSVLEAKKDVQASGFYAALLAALHATCVDDNGDEEQSAGSDGSIAEGSEGRSNDVAATKGSAAGSGSPQQQQQHRQEQLTEEGSHDSGGSSSSMAVDQPSGSSPMATDGSPPHDAAANTQSGVAAADDARHGSPTSYAAAARTHLPAAAPQAAGGTAPHRAATASPQRRWRWTDVRELVVYGLGSFESGPVPRCQLALTLLLAEAAGGRLATPPQLFDPAFTEVDKMLLQEMGCALIPRNEHGRRAFGGDSSRPAVNGHAHAEASRPAEVHRAGAGGCALVYLAHCKPELCNALLDANWTPAQLASFAIIGNSMYTCEETWAVKSMRQVFAARPSRTLALARARAVAETRLPEHGFPVTGAFNDVTFHIVTAPDTAAAADADYDSD